VLVYGSLLGAIAAALVISVLLRVPLDVDVIRDRNTLYRETNEGLVENVYTLRILNMDNSAHTYRLSAEGIEGMRMQGDAEHLTIESGQVRELVVRLQADPANLKEPATTSVSMCKRRQRQAVATRKHASSAPSFAKSACQNELNAINHAGTGGRIDRKPVLSGNIRALVVSVYGYGCPCPL